jgi:predicted MFS family arabinose efflux permease
MDNNTQQDLSPAMALLMAIATGLIVANLYYAQTLVGPISAATGLSPAAAGLIVTLTQVGYCLGLLFIVPLVSMKVRQATGLLISCSRRHTQ